MQQTLNSETLVMKRLITCLAVATLFAACTDSQDEGDLGSLASAFQSIPLGFDSPEHSFATPPPVPLWSPEGTRPGPGMDKRSAPDGHRGDGLPFVMGGGLGG